MLCFGVTPMADRSVSETVGRTVLAEENGSVTVGYGTVRHKHHYQQDLNVEGRCRERSFR